MPLTKFQRANGFWYLRGHVDRKQKPLFESTGTRDEETAEAARQAKEDFLRELARKGPKAVVTFDYAADSYVEGGGDETYLLKIGKDGKPRGLTEHFRGVKLMDIGQDALDRAAKELHPNASAATRNRQVYTPFIAVWNHAVRSKWADAHAWKRPKEKKGTARRQKLRAGTHPVSYERAWEFVSAMSPAPAMVMTALFYTGMRPIELFALEAPDVNVEGRWITLQSSKSGEPRGVPLHEVLVPLFTALVARGGVLFRTHDNEPYPLTEDGGGQISSGVEGARRRLKRAGKPIDDISPYTARHTVSTQLVLNGVHPYLKDQILGHAVTDMSRRYTHVPQQPLIDAINTLPVIEAWRDAPWMAEPVKWQRRFVRYSQWGKTKRSVQKDVQSKPKPATT